MILTFKLNLQVYNNGSSSFTGHRMHLVMLALPFVLRGLISSIVEDISSRIKRSITGDQLHGMVLPVDPTDSIFEVLHCFMVWYLTIRMPVIVIDLLVESQSMAEELVECLKRVFPDRDGKESGWKIGKCHDVLHVAQNIALFGWTQNTSDDWGERGHRELLKCLSGCGTAAHPPSGRGWFPRCSTRPRTARPADGCSCAVSRASGLPFSGTTVMGLPVWPTGRVPIASEKRAMTRAPFAIES
jgi:hypothetical protein